tara:strand:- start:2048 stop:3349 length:1302 start_codon:yes stop_codon:yes gene_type:complete
MAGKSNTSATFFAQKKLLGKAHTSNLKTDGEELIGSNIQASTSLLFGQSVPANPAQTLYLMQSASNGSPATVEYIHFALNALTGTTYDANETNPDGGSGTDSGESSQTSGVHTYKFVFRSDYSSNSSNPKKGNGNFNDSKIVHETLGKVQLVPPFYSQTAPNPYIIKIYKDDGSGGIGDEIPLLDNVDWNVDFYNGILFLQDFNSSKIPAHAKAFAYVGDFADKGFFENSLSGSLQKLTDGSSYLVAGSNITIASASNGQITISSTGGGGSGTPGGANTQIQFNDGGSFAGDTDLTYDKTANALQSAGFVTASLGFSGSLTNLADGTSFIKSSTGINVASASNGAITLKVNKEMVFNELCGGSTNGSNTLFTLANTPFASNEISIFVNGLLQTPPALTDFQDYSVTGSNIFFTTGSVPDEGSVVIAMYNKVVT